jgi:hypothetical protein
MDDESPMTTALARMMESDARLRVVAVRRHAALVRALLEELERLVPSAGAKAHEEVIGEQLIEELTLLCHRFQECTAAMASTAIGSEDAGRW